MVAEAVRRPALAVARACAALALALVVGTAISNVHDAAWLLAILGAFGVGLLVAPAPRIAVVALAVIGVTAMPGIDASVALSPTLSVDPFWRNVLVATTLLPPAVAVLVGLAAGRAIRQTSSRRQRPDGG